MTSTTDSNNGQPPSQPDAGELNPVSPVNPVKPKRGRPCLPAEDRRITVTMRVKAVTFDKLKARGNAGRWLDRLCARTYRARAVPEPVGETAVTSSNAAPTFTEPPTAEVLPDQSAERHW